MVNVILTYGPKLAVMHFEAKGALLMPEVPLYLADGVSSCSTHNGIHRLVLFQLSKEAKPGEVVEIAIPDRALKDIVDVLSRVLIRN